MQCERVAQASNDRFLGRIGVHALPEGVQVIQLDEPVVVGSVLLGVGALGLDAQDLAHLEHRLHLLLRQELVRVELLRITQHQRHGGLSASRRRDGAVLLHERRDFPPERMGGFTMLARFTTKPDARPCASERLGRQQCVRPRSVVRLHLITDDLRLHYFAEHMYCERVRREWRARDRCVYELPGAFPELPPVFGLFGARHGHARYADWFAHHDIPAAFLWRLDQ